MSDAATAMPFSVTPNSTVPAQQQMDQQMQMTSYSGAGTSYGAVPVGSSPQQYHQGQPIPPGAIVLKHVNSSDGKRKRGRPRKYGADGSMPSAQQQPVALPQSFPAAAAPPPPPIQTEPQMPGTGSASPTVKKARGRPPGASNKKQRVQREPLGSTGIGFIAHVLHVQAGEDIASKIMAFSQNGPRAVCVLSATGTISNVTLRQAATSGGTATYEGRYDILSISGSFMLMEVGGQKTRTGGLSITLSGSDGRVFGGCVAGILLAASAVQVIVGSFLSDGRQDMKSPNHVDPFSGQVRMNQGGPGTSSSPSRGTLSESSGGPASPLNLSSGPCNNLPQGMMGIPWK